jgi:hypothetical protein
MSISIENREWEEFFIEEIADIISGKDIYEAERIDGLNPYVSSTARTNGIGYFVGNNNPTYQENCLSVNRNGSVGYCFYHPYKALFSNDCRKLVLKKESHLIGMFISHQITLQKNKYNYGYKMGTGRLKRQKILLPITKSGKPDWQFMEEYISSMITEKKSAYIAYAKKQLKQLEYMAIPSLEEKEWDEFFIEEITEIKPGKRLTKADMSSGIKPFIGSTDSNNGITEFVSDTNASEDRNVLGVNYNGSVVENFYHPYTAIFSDDVKRLLFKEVEGNKYLYLFLKNAILKQKSKYQYAYKFNETRLRRQKIMLPITKNGKPDYAYMEQYMRNLEYTKRKQYLDYLKKHPTQLAYSTN